MAQNAQLKFTAMVVVGAAPGAKDSELYGGASALGECSFDINPMLPELLDQYGTGIRRKIEFRRAASGEAQGVVVGRGSCSLKLVGDYLSKFDSVAEGTVGAPKKAVGDVRQLPAERPDFSWRVRCDVRGGSNMPLNDLINQGLPSCFMEFGWSLSDNTDAATGA